MLPISPQISHIHSPLRGATRVLCDNGTYVVFQSTPPCGGDYNCSQQSQRWKYFNPRPHAGATPRLWTLFSFPNFNPRPHAGATGSSPKKASISLISIHAPMRGRRRQQAVLRFSSEFQSTPPCGGDWLDLCREKQTEISIHAPMRGRQTILTLLVNLRNFNPRPHAGATGHFLRWGAEFQISIHAPMRGRHVSRDDKTGISPFQSTPPCGGDCSNVHNPRSSAISIHAPMRGRLFIHSTTTKPFPISIHAPMRGRRVFIGFQFFFDNFNPRPHAGATYCCQ